MEEQHEEEINFIDAEQYRSAPDAPLTYEMVVLEQIRKCVNEGSKEMMGGFWKDKQTSRGIITEYVPDQRQVYIRCIMSMHDLLQPFFDDEMKKEVSSFEKSIKEIEENILSEIKNTDISSNTFKQIEYQIKMGYLDTNSIEYKKIIDEQIKIYRRLYQKLILLFHRNKYLLRQDISD